MLKLSYKFQEYTKTFIVYIDETPWKELHTSLFGRRFSFPKSIETMQALQEYFEKIEYQRSFEYACRQLSMRGYLASALHERLTDKRVSKETADKVIAECLRLGYLNDAQWIEHFIQKQIISKRSAKYIEMKLQSKGIPSHQARLLVREQYPEEDQSAAIQKLLNGRFKKYDLNNFKEKQKVQAALYRLGFSWDNINASIHMIE